MIIVYFHILISHLHICLVRILFIASSTHRLYFSTREYLSGARLGRSGGRSVALCTPP